jgi:CO dehydrogenase/acetyl-CoA synthase alpha subunit
MGRHRMPLPSLWRLNELFCLSDRYPSGLEWKIAKAGYKPGDQAGRKNKVTGFYVVSVDNATYLAHRIVQYMRTEKDLTHCTVSHGPDNLERDNRKELLITKSHSASRYSNG